MGVEKLRAHLKNNVKHWSGPSSELRENKRII
jgi:hypothetical protein